MKPEFSIHPMVAARQACRQKLILARYHLVRKLSSLMLTAKTHQDSVYVWPPFEEQCHEEMRAQLLSNAMHYLNGLDITLRYFVKGDGPLHTFDVEPPFTGAKSTGSCSLEAARKLIRRARFTLVWRQEGVRLGSSVRPHIYDVETGVGKCDANEWLRLTTDLYLQKRKFPDRVVPLPSYPVRNCAVLGTGPSYEQFLEEGMSYDAWVGANSIACDERIRKFPNAFAICMLDPYIFSPLDSMRPTLQGAFDLLRETPAVLITTRNFAAFIELNFPEDIKRKCLYVSTLGHDGLFLTSGNELRRLMVVPFGNVLTDLMLPVAASISQNVVIYGCDGKKPGSDGFFAKGGAVSTVDDKQTEQLAEVLDHRMYDSYVEKHNIFTRYVVDCCCQKGVRVYLGKPSWNFGLRHLKIISDLAND
ncbi:hypothetical protein KP005_11275 [Geomonas nitrogeniifigens]|uniref:Uncharacterized protein n=1 Tax=Geomonas diazotrophica TaxID=2843197 RepID=A0ABX8JFP6_9BACT|nr:hypothetical protein [Geomonas nitrogeniifigens]QWV95966.1 hypothetical protein KP005_11275 [Geomonas nitrogeniifigens]